MGDRMSLRKLKNSEWKIVLGIVDAKHFCLTYIIYYYKQNITLILCSK